ncbi:hypothetical protein ACFL2A_06975 [Thermodesulfobacteriota bacterium]
MKKLPVIILLLLAITLSGAKKSEAGSSVSVSIRWNNGYILAGGGALAIGWSIHCFSGKGESKMSRIFYDGEPRYASLLSFDMENDRYKVTVPDVTAGDDSVWVPLFNLKF